MWHNADPRNLPVAVVVPITDEWRKTLPRPATVNGSQRRAPVPTSYPSVSERPTPNLRWSFGRPRPRTTPGKKSREYLKMCLDRRTRTPHVELLTSDLQLKTWFKHFSHFNNVTKRRFCFTSSSCFHIESSRVKFLFFQGWPQWTASFRRCTRHRLWSNAADQLHQKYKFKNDFRILQRRIVQLVCLSNNLYLQTLGYN